MPAHPAMVRRLMMMSLASSLKSASANDNYDPAVVLGSARNDNPLSDTLRAIRLSRLSREELLLEADQLVLMAKEVHAISRHALLRSGIACPDAAQELEIR